MAWMTKWKTAYLLVCWFHIYSGDCLHLWLLGTLVYLTVFGIYTDENSWGVHWTPRDFTRNIKSFGSSSIYVVCDTNKTGTRALKLATKWKTNSLLGCWLRISSGDGFHLWLLGTLFYLTFFSIDTVENIWSANWIYRDFTRNMKSFGLSSIYVVYNIKEIQKIRH